MRNAFSRLSFLCTLILIVACYVFSSSTIVFHSAPAPTSLSQYHDEVDLIPDLVHVLPDEYLQNFSWVGPTKAWQCLANKRILILGDSTCMDFTHDLVRIIFLLLTGSS